MMQIYYFTTRTVNRRPHALILTSKNFESYTEITLNGLLHLKKESNLSPVIAKELANKINIIVFTVKHFINVD